MLKQGIATRESAAGPDQADLGIEPEHAPEHRSRLFLPPLQTLACYVARIGQRGTSHAHPASNRLWVYVRTLFHICGNSRNESGAELQLEGGVEFGNGSRAEFQPDSYYRDREFEKTRSLKIWVQPGHQAPS